MQQNTEAFILDKYNETLALSSNPSELRKVADWINILEVFGEVNA